jgi:hypothetical protein
MKKSGRVIKINYVQKRKKEELAVRDKPTCLQNSPPNSLIKSGQEHEASTAPTRRERERWHLT